MTHKNLSVRGPAWACYSTSILFGLCCNLIAPSPVRAASFSITPIATTGNEFTNLSAGIAINDQGTVSFIGDTPFDSGVFTGNGNSITPILRSADFPNLSFQGGISIPLPVSYFLGSQTAINNRGSVLFNANKQFGTGGPGRLSYEGLFKIENGVATQIGDLLFSVPGTRNFTSFNLNEQGSVVASVEAVFRDPPFTFYSTQVFLNGESIASGGGQGGSPFLNSRVESPDINNQGSTFYSLSESSLFDRINLDTIIEYNNGVKTQVIDQPVFTSFLAVNDQEQIVISGFVNPQSGILLLNNGVTTLISNGTGPVDINNAGTIAFQVSGRSSGEPEGIFVRSNNSLDRIIAIGDSLFSSTVTKLAFPNAKGLNNQGQVAFFAELADGSRGIFRADPISTQIPEPATALGLAALAGFGLHARRKNRSSLLSHRSHL